MLKRRIEVHNSLHLERIPPPFFIQSCAATDWSVGLARGGGEGKETQSKGKRDKITINYCYSRLYSSAVICQFGDNVDFELQHQPHHSGWVLPCNNVIRMYC